MIRRAHPRSRRAHRTARVRHRRQRLLIAGLVVGLTGLLTTPAAASATLVVTPITWDELGLDPADPAAGPETFPIGARVCNVGTTEALGPTAALVWDTVEPRIAVRGRSEVDLPTLSPGSCTVAMFDVAVERVAPTLGATRGYHLEAAAEGAPPATSAGTHVLHVGGLTPRAEGTDVAIGGAEAGRPAPTELVVGHTYTYRLSGDLPPGGVDQLSASLVPSGSALRVRDVHATYESPSGATTDGPYVDACGWDPSTTGPTAASCVGPPQVSGGRVGGRFVTSVVVEAVAPGDATLTPVIVDSVGGHGHYVPVGDRTLSVSVRAATASLEIRQRAADRTVGGGDRVRWTIDVTNVGTADAGPVELTDHLPDGSTLVSLGGHGWTCAPPDDAVRCDRGGIAPGATATAVVEVVAPPRDAELVNRVSARAVTGTGPGQDLATGSSSDAVRVLGAVDLAVRGTSWSTPLGDGRTVALDISNRGGSTARETSVTIRFPATTPPVGPLPDRCTGDADIVTCDLADLAPGASRHRRFDLASWSSAPSTSAGTGPTVHAVVSAANTDSAPHDDQVTVALGGATDGGSVPTTPSGAVAGAPAAGLFPGLMAAAGDADLSVTLGAAPDPVPAGTTLTYVLTVTNAGPSDAPGSVVDLVLPTGVSFSSAAPEQGTCTAAGTTVACALGTVTNGDTVQVLVATRPGPGTEGTVTASATVTANPTDPDPSGNTAGESSVVSPAADLVVTTSDGRTAITAGTATTYDVVVTNEGATTVPAGITVTDTLPSGTVATSSDCSVSGSTATCTTTGALAEGASATFSITVSVPSTTPLGTLTNVASIASSPVADPDAGNDTASDTTAIERRADLAVSLDAPDGPVPVGASFTVAAAVTNNGPSTSEAATLVVGAPAGTLLTTTTGGCASTGTAVTCTLGTLAPAATATASVVVHVAEGPDGERTTTAGADATTDDPDTANDVAQAVTTIGPVVDLMITSSSPVTTATTGETVRLAYRLANRGSQPATTVLVRIPVASNVSVAGIHASPGVSCSSTRSAVTCAMSSLGAGASVEIGLDVRVLSAGTVAATATVTAAETESFTHNNSTTVAVTVSGATLAVTGGNAAALALVGLGAALTGLGVVGASPPRRRRTPALR